MFRILVQIKKIIKVLSHVYGYSRYINILEELQLKSLTLVNSLTCSFKKLRVTLKYFLAKLFSVFWLHWNAPNYVKFQTEHTKAFLLVYKDSFSSSETKLQPSCRLTLNWLCKSPDNVYNVSILCKLFNFLILRVTNYKFLLAPDFLQLEGWNVSGARALSQ